MNKQMKIVHSLQKKQKKEQAGVFTQMLTGLLSVFKFAIKKPKENRLTKVTFTEKELFWRKEIQLKLQKQKAEKEAKKLEQLLDNTSEKKKKSVHTFNHNLNQKRKAQ
jgi:hypothetical protein